MRDKNHKNNNMSKLFGKLNKTKLNSHININSNNSLSKAKINSMNLPIVSSPSPINIKPIISH
jgi:hypothetical protein